MDFEVELRRLVAEKGGWWNAHAHLDRSYVMDKKFVQHYDMDPWDIATYPLEVKQHTTGILHEGLAYTKESLYERLSFAMQQSIKYNVRRIESFIDTTADIGLRALETALEVKREVAASIDFQVGAYPIYGFKELDLRRWDIFIEGCQIADFIGTLPERDARRTHIGFEEHFRRIIPLIDKYGKELHCHVDQTNDPAESGTETLIQAVKWLRPHNINDNKVWAVHSLSVSSYDEDRFKRLIEGLQETGIGIIVCPTATLSNKQNRQIQVPMHNSITRVLDFLLNDIPVRLGIDNVQDFFIPTGNFDMFNEVYVAANALRFYNYGTWAKIATSEKLNEVDKMKIRNAMRN